jgi:hypothetical protein
MLFLLLSTVKDYTTYFSVQTCVTHESIFVIIITLYLECTKKFHCFILYAFYSARLSQNSLACLVIGSFKYKISQACHVAFSVRQKMALNCDLMYRPILYFNTLQVVIYLYSTVHTVDFEAKCVVLN